MLARTIWVVVALLLALSFSAQGQAPAARPASAAAFSFPLMFEENLGQAAHGKYVSHGPGYGMEFEPGRVNLLLRGVKNGAKGRAENDKKIQLTFPGANPHAVITPSEKLATRTNYYLGNDPAQWRTGVVNFSKLEMAGIWPGTDLVFYGNNRQLEHDFVVAPFADPSRIALRVGGADTLKVAGNGDLVMATNAGDLRFRKPYAYQKIGGQTKTVDARFKIMAGNITGFTLGKYDPRYELVIDPVLIFASYVGGALGSTGAAVTVDGFGDTYITGTTSFDDFNDPNQNTKRAGTNLDAFIAKFNGETAAVQGQKNLQTLAWLTFFGGSGDETAQAIAVDDLGTTTNVYVAGSTTGAGSFPIMGSSYQSASTAKQAGFAARFDIVNGLLNYSTFLSGTGTQSATGIAFLTANGSSLVYVAGSTDTGDIRTSGNSFQPQFQQGQGQQAGFVLAIDPTISGRHALQYGTFLRGTANNDHITVSGIAVVAVTSDPSIFLSGTASGDFPQPPQAPNGFISTVGGGEDAFAIRLTPNNADGNGGDLDFATLVGGPDTDQGNAIAVDAGGQVVLAGFTQSDSGIATSSVLQPVLGDANVGDGFIAVINAVGAIESATYFGGPQKDSINGVALEKSNGALVNILVAGETRSTIPAAIPPNVGFPRKSPPNSNSGFIAKVNPTLGKGSLIYLTYLDGSQDVNKKPSDDRLVGIAVDPSNAQSNVAVVGTFNSVDASSTSSAFQIKSIAQPANPPSPVSSAYVAKFASDPQHKALLTVTPGTPSPDPIAFIGPDNPVTLTDTWTVTNTDKTNPATSVVVDIPMPQGVGGDAFDSTSYATKVTGGACTTNTGGITCVIPSLDPGTSATVTVSAQVTAKINPASGTTVLPVKAAVASAQSGVAQVSTESSSVTPVFVALSSQPSASTVSINQPITYTLAADNSKNTVAAPNITVDLPIDKNFTPTSVSSGCATIQANGNTPAHITCTANSVPAATSTPFTITGFFNPNAVSANQPMSTIAQTAAISGTLSPATSVPLITTVQRSAKLTLAVTGPTAPIALGSPASFTFQIANPGPNDAVNVALNNILPTGFKPTNNSPITLTLTPAGQVQCASAQSCLIPLFAVGQTAAGTINGTFPDNGAAGIDAVPVGSPSSSVSDSATLSSTEVVDLLSPKTAPNSSASLTVNRQADLGVAFATLPPSQIGATDIFSYSVTVTNSPASPNIATNVSLAIPPPPGMTVTSSVPSATVTNQICDLQGGTGCSVIPAINPGGSFTYTVTGSFLALDIDPATGGTKNSEPRTIPVNVATVAGGVVDANPANNTAPGAAITITEVNTHLGKNVQVVPDAAGLPAAVTFGNVSSIGVTQLTTGPIAQSPFPLPVNYKVGQSGTAQHYDLTTTAVATSTVANPTTVCVNAPDSFIKPARARMFVLNANGGPVDITSSIAPAFTTEPPLIFSAGASSANPTPLTQVCGTLPSANGQGPAFSPNNMLSFAVLEPVNHAPTFMASVSSTPSSAKGSNAESLVITANQETDQDDNDPCTLGANRHSVCSDRPQVKTFLFNLFGTFLSAPQSCPNGPCSFVDLTKSDLITTVNLSGANRLCIAAFDQTVSSDEATIRKFCINPTSNRPDGLFTTIVDINPGQNGGNGATNSGTVSAGQSATTSIGLLGIASSTTTFACAAGLGTPSLASLEISCAVPQSAQPQDTSIPLSLVTTGNTFARLAPGPNPPGSRLPWYGLAAAPLAGILLLGGRNGKKRSAKAARVLLAFAGLALIGGLQIGCGGHIGSGSPQTVQKGTPAGAYKIVVTTNDPNFLFDAGDGNGTQVGTYAFTLTVVN